MTRDERERLHDDLTLIQDWLEAGRVRARSEAVFEEGAPPPSEAEIIARPGAARPPAFSPPEDDSLERIAAEVRACGACRLRVTRRNAVPGSGASRPLVLVVGEGPGADEDASGEPFVGAAGQLLDRMLEAIGLSRSRNCFIGNVVKCRPPGNRDPLPDERAPCLPFLRRQIAVLQPRYILCLGRIAAQTLLDSTEGISKLRGRFFEFEGVPLIATFHPSALLRDDQYKRPAWEDLKTLRERIQADGWASGAP